MSSRLFTKERILESFPVSKSFRICRHSKALWCVCVCELRRKDLYVSFSVLEFSIVVKLLKRLKLTFENKFESSIPKVKNFHLFQASFLKRYFHEKIRQRKEIIKDFAVESGPIIISCINAFVVIDERYLLRFIDILLHQ